MWGGVECTFSRVGDEYIDQLELTGHAHRLSDIGRIASLGVSALRYPVIWERTAPEGVASADWRWPDQRLALIREHGIVPVVGLVHHGSGPHYTSFDDPAFPAKLAAYARACAERYPWIDTVTPLNEPLTTARFAGLYGHWHPHMTDDRSFVRILLAECVAIRSAMQAIREIIPCAQLLQPEDLGHTHASDGLSYQADFENERRWLTWDLMCGRVVRGHPMYDYLMTYGATPKQLDDLATNPCPPNQVGVDHYITSERYLDADVEAHEHARRGGNGRDRYADVEVTRVRPELRRGAAALLRDAWHRYNIPLVLAEAHLACDDEKEGVRWLVELWNAALDARDAGCDVRAVAAWALFGSCGWNELATRRDGQYAAGAFDVASGAPGQPRETGVARAIRSLARDGRCDDESLASPGWWNCTSADRAPRRRASTAS